MNTPPLAHFTLPTAKLLLSAVLTSVAAAAGWAIITRLGPWDITTTLVGLIGIGIVAFVSVLGTLAMRPWHPRTVVAWGDDR